MKSFFKEIFIMFLICVVLFIVLSITFYDLVPTNKIIPASIKYQLPSELAQIVEEIDTPISSNTEQTIITYELTKDELDRAKKINYDSGKENPFEIYNEQPMDFSNNSNSNIIENDIENSSNSSSSTTEENQTDITNPTPDNSISQQPKIDLAPIPLPELHRTFRIVNQFYGYDQYNIYELSDGTIWIQTDYYSKYYYKYRPEVLIYKDGIKYYMKVDGIDKSILVEPISFYHKSKLVQALDYYGNETSSLYNDNVYLLSSNLIFKQNDIKIGTFLRNSDVILVQYNGQWYAQIANKGGFKVTILN